MSNCPVFGVGDIKCYALHYATPEEACACWSRRASRADLNNVFVIANAWNLHYRADYIERLDALSCPTVIFSDVYFDYPSVFKMPGDFWQRDDRGIVRPNITDVESKGIRYFERFFDFVHFLNSPFSAAQDFEIRD